MIQFTRRFLLIPAFLMLACLSFANNGEQSRVLIHTLNYISHDYQYAVVNGKIASVDEYEEATEFGQSAVKYYKQFAPGWLPKDSVEIGLLIYRIDSLISRHAPFEIVSPLASEAKNRVIGASGLAVEPAKYPNLQSGKIIFLTECAKCHGTLGMGDGPEGKDLNPKPRNFMDAVRMKTISPFTAFNTIRLGIEGTGMKAHPQLDDKDVWDVAFYITSLRYQSMKFEPFLREGVFSKIVDSISLSKIVVNSDEELAELFPMNDEKKQLQLFAAIRLNQPVTDESEYLQTSLKYINGAMELYQQGNYSEASQLATLAYLEGVEPIEAHLRATDPALMGKLEDQMQNLRKMMESKNSMVAVHDSVKAVRNTMASISSLLVKKSYSFWMALFLAASILLREGLEAFLVILVILSLLKATALRRYKFWVHAGWISAVLFGVLLWFAGGALLAAQMRYVELMEGIISLIAVVMLLYVGFWLHSKSEIGKWREYVNNLVKNATSNGSMLGLAGLSFVVVFREVFESVLFLSALQVESGGQQQWGIGLGVITAFVVVISLAFIVLQFSAKLPIAGLFKVSSIVMGVLAAVLIGKAVHAFQQTGHLPVHSLPIGRLELLGIYPTVETCLAQALILALVVVLWINTNASKK